MSIALGLLVRVCFPIAVTALDIDVSERFGIAAGLGLLGLAVIGVIALVRAGLFAWLWHLVF
ncbi:hypothetical protein ACFQX7_20840 [Luedemannella flava]